MVAALITSLLTGCLGFLQCAPRPASLSDLAALIFENDAGEADVTEQIIIDARMLAAAEAGLE